MDLELAPRVRKALVNGWEPVYRSQLHYLVTWTTRGRKPVLKDRHFDALRTLMRQTCEERDIDWVDMVAGRDHVHVLFSLRPAQSVASAIRELKGRTSTQLISQFPELRVWLRGNLLWDERNAVETVSPLRLPKMRERLEQTHRALADHGSPETWAAAS